MLYTVNEVKEGGLPCVVPSCPMRHFIALMICSATGGHIDVAYTALWEWVRKKSTRSLHKQNKAWMSFELVKQQISILTTAGVRTCERKRMFHQLLVCFLGCYCYYMAWRNIKQVQILYHVSGAITAETKVWSRIMFTSVLRLIIKEPKSFKGQWTAALKTLLGFSLGMKKSLHDISIIPLPQDRKSNLTGIYLWLLACKFLSIETFHHSGRDSHLRVGIIALTFPCITKSTICAPKKSIDIL